VALAELAAGRR